MEWNRMERNGTHRKATEWNETEGTHLEIDGVVDDFVVALVFPPWGKLLVKLAAQPAVLGVLCLLDILKGLQSKNILIFLWFLVSAYLAFDWESLHLDVALQ